MARQRKQRPRMVRRIRQGLAAGIGRPRCVEVVVNDSEVVLRARLLDSTVRLPVTFTFGFQATPVKPWPTDFHEWRIWHVPQLGVGSTLPVPKEWWLCHRAFPDRNPQATLDRAAELGAKTAVFHEDWLPIQNYPVTAPEADFKRIVDACHERGMKVLVYHGYELSSLAPEWAELSDEVLVKDTQGRITPGWYRHPEQRDFRVCYNSVWADRLADGIGEARRRYGFDGLYLDGTIEPWGCCNERHGCGYRAADGSLRPTYPIFGVRRLMQRLYAMFHPGGLISAHQSTCCATPTLAWADSYWDGEQFAGGELSGDPLKKLPLGAFARSSWAATSACRASSWPTNGRPNGRSTTPWRSRCCTTCGYVLRAGRGWKECRRSGT